MSNEILNSLLREYEQRKLNAELDLEKRKESLYKKYPKLQEGDECMKKFCEKVQEKKEDFKQAAQESINLFE